jgi:hypothetical protein
MSRHEKKFVLSLDIVWRTLQVWNPQSRAIAISSIDREAIVTEIQQRQEEYGSFAIDRELRQLRSSNTIS